MSMTSVSLDPAVLRLQMPTLVLRPGTEIVVRVASRGEGLRGAIVLAGQLLGATLPEEVQTGDVLRLRVAETTPQRLVLRVVPEPPGGPGTPPAHEAAGQAPATAAPSAAPSAPAVALGVDAAALAAQAAGQPRVVEDRAGGQAGRREREGRSWQGVAVSYDAPALGRLELRVDQADGAVVVVVTAPAGSAPLALERAEELRAALSARTHSPASVRVEARREPFDALA